MKLEEGDEFERQNANWIRLNLPSYEQVWSAFIGHFKGYPLPIEGLTDNQRFYRTIFFQAHYSTAVDARSLDQLLEKASNNLADTRELCQFQEAYDILERSITKVGRIRDHFLRIDGALKMHGALVSDLQAFYDQRSNIMHGPQMPVRFSDEGFLMIPKVAGRNPLEGEWQSKSSWEDVAGGPFILLADFAQGLRKDFFELLVRLHPKIFEVADQFFGGKRIAEHSPPVIETPEPPQVFYISGCSWTEEYPKYSTSAPS